MLEAVAKRGEQHRAQIVEADIVTVPQQCVALGGEHQALRSPRAYPEANVTLHLGWNFRRVDLGALDEARHRTADMGLSRRCEPTTPLPGLAYCV
jgi:hypothetical protein